MREKSSTQRVENCNFGFCLTVLERHLCVELSFCFCARFRKTFSQISISAENKELLWRCIKELLLKSIKGRFTIATYSKIYAKEWFPQA